MERKSLYWTCAILVAASLSGLAACSSDNSTSTPAAVPATAQPETVMGEAYGEMEATIQAVDTKNRNVTLGLADGSSQTLTAPADADLSRVKAGDVVILGAYQKVSVRALPPGSAPLGVQTQAATAKAEPGETPGRVVAEATTAVFEVTAIDLANNKVTLRGADGATQTLDVKNPDNQRKLQTLNVGDLVEMNFIEAASIRLKPKT